MKCPNDRSSLVVTLCGSTRFKDEFLKVQEELTLAGHIVLSPGVFVHTDHEVDVLQKRKLDDLHRRKIDLSDWIYVVNPVLYFGASTWSEISYAWMTGKGIVFEDGGEHIHKLLPFMMENRLEVAHEIASYNLASYRETLANSFEDVLYPCFLHHGVPILDPWLTPEANNVNAADDPRDFEYGPDRVVEDPFEFYGANVVARYLETILMAHLEEDLEQEAQDFYEELLEVCLKDLSESEV